MRAPLVLIALLASWSGVLPGEEKPLGAVLDAVLTDIDGKPYPLAQHKGKVLLIVNVASRCGNTPQYAGLERLWGKYREAGLVVIGVPANDFGKQEPGTDAEIKEFCSARYKVTFPMMSKVSVKGEAIDPLFRLLTTTGAKPGPVTWNFGKFLVGRDGAVADRFDPGTKPESPAVAAAIEKALGLAPAPARPADQEKPAGKPAP